ncbi:DNA-binding MurR/RpiR family transcriptional regulator [Lactobacillus colini]|uniref:DNA-binding MurR/RpiR family transcriptional regulator n=1 Tax=Lactobacillus colini TaxID=1819254 RepID=A0ABS4MEW7_9LACO|nr:MurR/RpiR family transcriptional regulator [Lactobacillus colini]MBP2058238.1 DNA-binding MurR/RpiR family transcriptional regulator [Lactobacillus colini]
MDFIQIVNQHRDELTKSEEKLVNYIITNNDKVIYDTIKALGKVTATGDGTIIRLCKKLGFSGFSDLKIALAKQSMESENKKSQDNYIDKSESLLVTAIEKTRSLINMQELDKAINLLIKAKNVYIFGVGHSGESARDFAKTWLRIGLIAHAEPDPHIQVQVSNLLNKDDVVVGLSLSGHTKDTYDSLKLAKNNGSNIIVITNELLSPIAKLGDAKLQTAAGEFSSIGSVAGQTSQLFICDVLARGYEKISKIDSNAIKQRAIKAVMKKKK